VHFCQHLDLIIITISVRIIMAYVSMPQQPGASNLMDTFGKVVSSTPTAPRIITISAPSPATDSFPKHKDEYDKIDTLGKKQRKGGTTTCVKFSLC